MVLPPTASGARAPRPPHAPIDRDPPRRAGEHAFVTMGLIAANVVVMVLMITRGVAPLAPTAQELLGWGANFGPLTLGGEWWRLVSACFVHAGLIHIGFNMYVLSDLGRITERIYGSLGFALVYLVAGIGGSFASVAIHPMRVSVGASGAVFGVAGAFLAFLLRNRGRIDPHVSSHLRRSLLTFVVVNLAIGYAVPAIDQAAHVGGLALGFLNGILVSPTVTDRGPVRAYWAYPIVAAVGVALCVAAWLGL